MVVSRLPIVVCLLTHLLCHLDFWPRTCGVGSTVVDSSRTTEPALVVVAVGVLRLLEVWAYGDAFTRETILRHVGTPSEGVTGLHGIVHHFHELVDR